MNPENRSVILLVWLAVPVIVLTVELVVGILLLRYWRSVHGMAGSHLLGALTGFVLITVVSQVMNVLLAIATIFGQGQTWALFAFLGLFFGAQILRMLAFFYAGWRILRLRHESVS